MTVEYGKIADVAFSSNTSAQRFVSVRFEQIEIKVKQPFIPKGAAGNDKAIASSSSVIARIVKVSKNPSTDSLIKLSEKEKSQSQHKAVKDTLDIRTDVLQSTKSNNLRVNSQNSSDGALSPTEVNPEKQLIWDNDDAKAQKRITEQKDSGSTITENTKSDFSENLINSLHFSKVV
jgi:hypothetical protein